MTSVAPPDVKIVKPITPTSQAHVLDQILEENNEKEDSPPVTLQSSPPLPTEHSSLPTLLSHEQEEGKYVCKLERKKSSIRRKRVLTAVTADDNKPVHIPLVEYGDQHDTYAQIAQRVMRGGDVTHGVRMLREKLGMLIAIRDACSRKIDVSLTREERIRRRARIKRTLVLCTFGFVWMSILAVIVKVILVVTRAYYGLIRDHIHRFRA